MKILLLSHLFPTAPGSAIGRFVEDQVRAVQAEGAQVTVVTVKFCRLSPFHLAAFLRAIVIGVFTGRAEIKQTSGGVQFHEIVCPAPRLGGVVQAWLYGICAKRFVARLSQAHKSFDLVHAHTGLLDGRAALVVGKFLKIPFVVTEHTGPFRSLLVRAGSKHMLREVFSRAAAVVAVSTSLKRDILEVFPELNHRAHVIPNTLSTADFSFRTDATIKAEVGWVGYITSVKRLDRLFLAFAKMRELRPDLVLKLITMDALPPALSELANQLKISSRVEFISANSRAAVAQALSSLSLLMVTSQTETFSVACLEGLAMGVPVVSTNCGGPSDLISVPDDGFIVETSDPAVLAQAGLAIIENSADSLESRRARSARAHERFSPKVVGLKYVELYRSLLAANNS